MPRTSCSVSLLRRVAALIVAASLLAGAPTALDAQSATPLTAEDLLSIRTVTAGDFSPDGKWLVVRMGQRREGLGFDASRDGDPSYTRPAGARLYLHNVQGGDSVMVLATPRTVGSMSWSPNGAMLAFVTRDSVPVLHLYHVASKRLQQVSWTGVRIADGTDLQWTNDNRLVLSIRERGWLPEVRARFDSLVRGPISVQTGSDAFLSWDALRRLGNKSLVVAFTPGTAKLDTLLGATQMTTWTIARNGRTVSWREDANTKTNYEGGQTNESKLMARTVGGATRTVFASLRGVNLMLADDGERYAFARDGAIFVGSLADTTAARRVIGPDVRDSTRTRAQAPDSAARSREERYTLVRVAPTGDAVVASTRAGLWLVDLASGTRRSIAAITDTVSGPRVTVSTWTDDGRTLYLSSVSRTSWNRAIVKVDKASGRADTLVRDGRIYGAPRLTADGSRMVLTIAANGMPADLWMAGPNLDAPQRIIVSNPQLANRAMPRTQLVQYLDADGRAQFGVLTLPAGNASKLPTVFSIYENFFDDTFDATTMYLASHGYAVMKPSVTFDIGYPGEAWLKGVTAAANKLIELGIADSAKLGVHGTSYGGYATNLLVTQTQRFKAAINISGKVDMISFYTDSPRLGVRNVNAAERTQDRIGATLWEQPQKYVQHSAVMFADRIRTPLLLMTGGEDHNVPALNTREMFYALRRLGRPVEWVNYVNGGHGIPMTNAQEFTDWHSRLLGWYDRYLKVPPARASATQ